MLNIVEPVPQIFDRCPMSSHNLGMSFFYQARGLEIERFQRDGPQFGCVHFCTMLSATHIRRNDGLRQPKAHSWSGYNAVRSLSSSLLAFE